MCLYIIGLSSLMNGSAQTFCPSHYGVFIMNFESLNNIFRFKFFITFVIYNYFLPVCGILSFSKCLFFFPPGSFLLGKHSVT
jgi:hypothetical protein